MKKFTIGAAGVIAMFAVGPVSNSAKAQTVAPAPIETTSAVDDKPFALHVSDQNSPKLVGAEGVDANYVTMGDFGLIHSDVRITVINPQYPAFGRRVFAAALVPEDEILGAHFLQAAWPSFKEHFGFGDKKNSLDWRRALAIIYEVPETPTADEARKTLIAEAEKLTDDEAKQGAIRAAKVPTGKGTRKAAVAEAKGLTGDEARQAAIYKINALTDDEVQNVAFEHSRRKFQETGEAPRLDLVNWSRVRQGEGMQGLIPAANVSVWEFEMNTKDPSRANLVFEAAKDMVKLVQRSSFAYTPFPRKDGRTGLNSHALRALIAERFDEMVGEKISAAQEAGDWVKAAYWITTPSYSQASTKYISPGASTSWILPGPNLKTVRELADPSHDGDPNFGRWDPNNQRQKIPADWKVRYTGERLQVPTPQ